MSQYFFFGKDCKIDRELENRNEFKNHLKNKNCHFKHDPIFVNQIHQNQVLVVENPENNFTQSPIPKADAIVTNIKSLPICVITADCVPIVFVDEKQNVAGISHAGWRGAKSGIIENTVLEMQNLGAKTNQIKAVIGPCIRQESYEVSQEFFEDFVAASAANRIFFKMAEKEGHFMFNLPQYCLLKLTNLGIANVKDLKKDTYQNEETLFSFRRSTHRGAADCGRNISTVIL